MKYILVMRILQVFFNPLQVPEYALFFFWISSYAFISLTALLMAMLYPQRYSLFGRLVGIGKILQALAAVLFLLFDYGVIPVLLNLLKLSMIQINAALMQGFIPLIIIVTGLDLAAAAALLLWKVEGNRKNPNTAFQITEIEEG